MSDVLEAAAALAIDAGLAVATNGEPPSVGGLLVAGAFAIYRKLIRFPADERLQEAFARGEVARIAAREQELEEALRKLREAGHVGVEADFVHVAQHYFGAQQHGADPRKRKLLEDAFVRSFDPELYESGLLNTLWGCLDRLSYGDLAVMRDLIEATTPENIRAVKGRHGLTTHGTIGQHHVSNLRREGLVWPEQRNSVDEAHPTELSRRLYGLAWGQLPEPGEQA